MQKIIPTLVLVPTLLIGCGMSDEEKANVAAVTCSVMSETRNMDAAVRVREINAAREKISEAPYLDGDEGIKQSFEFGLCEELVLNDPLYDEILEELQRIAAEEKRIALNKRYTKSLSEAISLAGYFDFPEGRQDGDMRGIKRALVLQFPTCYVPKGTHYRFFVTALGEKKMVTHKENECLSFHSIDEINDEESEFLKSISFSITESETSSGTHYRFDDEDVFTYSDCDETCWDETLE